MSDYKFNVGDRVVYIAALRNSVKEKKLCEGTVRERNKDFSDKNRYGVDGRIGLSHCREENLEFVAMSELEIGIAAYIAKEKKELGLG